MSTDPAMHSRMDEGVSATDLSVFHHLYTSIADEMGAVLARTAYSPNIKERKDFSCALFDEQGRLLAQAAHIPVHLGAMPRSVAAACKAFPRMGPGDVVMLNDPFEGGTHLPDVTLVSPVFAGSDCVGYAATRAHHADVGGMTPGSLPNSRTIHQEGLRIPPVRLVRGGEMEEDLMRIFCANSRNPGERRGDMRAQLHAHHIGETRWLELGKRVGFGKLREMNEALMDYADRRMRAALVQLPHGRWSCEEEIEDEAGTGVAAVLRGTLTVSELGVCVDVRGSDDRVPGSLNAVRAITESAVCYVFLCWMCRDSGGASLPINGGCFRCIDLQTRPGSVLDAQWPAAVAGGNVETSQRVVDLVLGLLDQALPGSVPAQSQGTMNNVTLGGILGGRIPGGGFAYYETLGGGAGGGPGVPGASALQTHMTNTLNTPVEAIEFAYPLRVRRLEIRHGSGGAGTFPGGDGLVREWEALAPMEVTVLTERRRVGPKGSGGGDAGKPGRQEIRMASGEIRPLPGKGSGQLSPGDVLRVETPGGGGFG
ncbi:MAG: hydantoinase B/oxoprolinase family protein [Verrucomicrobia bacterium]|nr:hydantoinase B/oxoprolinase family protein [Verrucomicrobiota bacterium]MCH8511069.1 hydantoinase B/oxoprolinase family protein [Kiritimatiellia bacterium]